MSVRVTIIKRWQKAFAPFLTTDPKNRKYRYEWINLSQLDDGDAKRKENESTTAVDPPLNECPSSDDQTECEQIRTLITQTEHTMPRNDDSPMEPIETTDRSTQELLMDLEADDDNAPSVAVADRAECLQPMAGSGSLENILCNLSPDGSDVDDKELSATDAVVNDTTNALNVELCAYIKFHEQNGVADKDIEAILGEPMPAIGSVVEVANTVQNAMPTDGLEDCEFLSPESINNLRTYEMAFNVIPDPKNPMLFHVRPVTSNIMNNVGRDESIFFNGHEIRPCYINIKDFRVKYKKPNPLETLDFCVGAGAVAVRRSTKKASVAKRKIPMTRRMNRRTAIKSLLARKKSAAAPKSVPPRTIEVETKTASIKEWIELCNQHPASINNDVFNFDSLPMLSDIEDDAFQMVKYLESTYQNDNELPMNNFVPVVTQQQQQEQQQQQDMFEQHALATAQQTNPTISIDRFAEPINLSANQQSTPMSTDTGFCSVFYPTPPYAPTVIPVPADPPYTHSLMPLPAGPTYDPNVIAVPANYANVWNANPDTSWVNNAPRVYGEDKATQTDPALSTPPEPSTPTTPSKPSTPLNLVMKRNLPDSGVSSMSKTRCSETESTVSSVKSPKRNDLLSLDWQLDNCSTELDYEPDEDDDGEKSVISDIRFDASQNTEFIATSPEPTPSLSSLIINVPNRNGSPTSRVVTRSHSISSRNSFDLTPSPFSQSTRPSIHKPTDEMPPPSSLPQTLQKAASPSQTSLLKSQVNYLFNGPCYRYMNGEPCRTRCNFNHGLPLNREVFEKLMQFNNEAVSSLYVLFIGKNRMVFDEYFPTVCKVFSRKRMERLILSTVTDCERHNKLSYYTDIYQALIRLDHSKMDALGKIGERSCNSRAASTSILDIIVREDPLFCIDALRKYYPRSKIQTHHMLALLYHLMDNPAPSLLRLFVDMFDKYSASDISDIGPYTTVYYELKSLLCGDDILIQHVDYVVSRDKRIDN